MTPESGDPPALRAKGLGKGFAGVTALADVSVDLPAGRVTAIMGENGAGKSTLLKILSGDHQPDTGRVLLDGRPVTFGSTAAAHRAGIRVIYQEPEIVPHVSVAENVYLGALPKRGPFVDRRELTRMVTADIERYGFAGVLHPGTLGRHLSAAQRQLVEILRALITEPKVIAFDEPTSSLSDHEVDALFALIGRLRDDGVAIAYVSHRIKEIFRIADVTENDLVKMMVGRDITAMFEHRHANATGDVLLGLRDVTTDDVRDVSLDVRAGEVVGLAGLVGAGRSELARAIVGDLPIRSGEVRVAGEAVRLRDPGDAKRAGIGLAPEERKSDALLLRRSVRDNASLAMLDRLRRFRLVRRQAERELVGTYAERLRIRTPSLEQEVRNLSGGNQQKVVLARWLARQPKVLILDEPTRGVDVGAKAEIYAVIDRLAADGVAVLVISSELPEILGICDRIYVMQGGRVTGELDRTEATEERVLALAMADQLDDPQASEGEST